MQHHIVCYSDHGNVPSFKGENHGRAYYLSPSNIYGLGIHDASNNICYVYTWTELEGKKGMNNISFFLLRFLNEKRCYSQSYGKNNKMTEIAILVGNCGGQNKNNIMIRFFKMIKEGGLF